VDDCVAAYRWVLDNPDELGVAPGAPGVMGDSAGATLSAVVCLEARRLGLAQPRMQCLVYPLADVAMRTPSYEIFAEGFGLTTEGVGVFRDTYVDDPSLWDDPRVSPLCAGDLSGLAPALVITAGFDVLRDDGRAYADALAAAGVPTTYRCHDDMIHGFHAMLVLDDAAAAADAIATEVGELMRTPPAVP
jgi:acetyl esterase